MLSWFTLINHNRTIGLHQFTTIFKRQLPEHAALSKMGVSMNFSHGSKHFTTGIPSGQQGLPLIGITGRKNYRKLFFKFILTSQLLMIAVKKIITINGPAEILPKFLFECT